MSHDESLKRTLDERRNDRLEAHGSFAAPTCSAAGEKLNRLVAIHVMKWTPRVQGHAQVTGWYDERQRQKNRRYKGIELPDWAWSVQEAIALLAHRHFSLWTCDDGYGCEIYSAPERGEDLMGVSHGFKLAEVICQALVASETQSPNAAGEPAPNSKL